ncbi:WD40 repeat-like protein [Rhizopogon vinicolor AM-OR11-026]|uniref:WD40 repeat-like protein n=1 Tax=Rhizopogon vinicolor AM-OR11-026 TaxID=1314800 RepID=A0A1B7MKV1_9AGAM|nr:WD40 repeat-like protein [Rhizopogon vinicolor AM-OR11-026]
MKDDKQPAETHQDPLKTFDGHEHNITSIATFPDGKRIVTGSIDKTIRIWRLADGREMKKWVVKKIVGALLILRDGKQVVSAEGDDPDDDFDKTVYWQLWVRDAETGRVVAGPLDGHSNIVLSLDISLDGGILASGSIDRTVILWDTTTWQTKGQPLECGAHVTCVQFSPTDQLGVATEEDIQVWDSDRRERLAQFKGHANFNSLNWSLTWTHDGTHLLSAGDEDDPVIRSWDTFTLKQAGNPWTGHDKLVYNIVLNPAGTLLASASQDHTVRLWQLSTGTEVARYELSDIVLRVAFSVDGRFIFSGGHDDKILQWEIPEDVLVAASGDSLAGEPKTKAGPLRGKKKHPKSHLDMEIPSRRRNMAHRRIVMPRREAAHSALPFRADADSSPSARLHGVKDFFFNRMWPLSDTKGKQKERRVERQTQEVVDVPLGQATYGDYIASDEDGRRPYALLCCLSWFQKKEKKPDPPQQVYDVDLMNAEWEEDPLDVPVPTRVRFVQQEDIALTAMASQPQPGAGPSCFPDSKEHAEA